MVSIQQPLLQLRQPLRRRPQKTTLAATDEFWFSPVLEMEGASRSSDATSASGASSASSAAPADPAASPAPPASPDGDDEGGDLMEVIVLPAAHRQLLSSDPASVEALKGYDHTVGVFGEDEDGYASDKSSFAPQRRLGGNWLLRSLTGEEEATPPGLVRVPSTASLESDECSTSSESDDEDDGGVPESSGKRPRGGVSFDETVRVQPIPHSNTLTTAQRKKIYTTSWEVRQNKIRNKKEYRYDGYNWRNATEEWEMAVDMVTGELIHPAHEFSK